MRLLVATPLPLLLNTLFAVSVEAVLVAPSSPCAVQCGNVLSSTTGSDLVCGDSSYAASATGQTLENCIACELNSTYQDPSTKQTDLQWLLYNLRYSVSWCLWGYPNNTNAPGTPCVTHFACGTLEDAVKYDDLQSNTTEFGYCSQWDNDLLPRCTACLSQGNQFTLANFITALGAGCQQQPPPGSQISLDGGLFQQNLVNITIPVNSSIPVYTAPPAGPLSLGAKVGIAIGGLVLLLMLGGCIVVCTGKRRRRVHLRRLAEKNFRAPEPKWKEYSSPGSESNRAFMAPDNQRWQGGNDDSPQSSRAGDHVFSPYQSTFTSPVSPDGAKMFPPVPIPLPYDVNARTRRGSEVSSPGSAGGNLIEMNQIRRTASMASSIAARSSIKPPIIKEPVPVLMRQNSLPLRQQTQSAEEKETEKAQAQAQVQPKEKAQSKDGEAAIPLAPGTAV